MKYSRTMIVKLNKDSIGVTEDTLNKWACQVFINCMHPEYKRRVENDEDTFVCLLVGNTREEVNNKFEKMNLER